MTGQEREDEDERAGEQEVGDSGELAPTEEDDPQPIPPAREPDPADLPDIDLAVAGAKEVDPEEIAEIFSPVTADFVETTRSGFALRLFGSSLGRRQIDPIAFAELLVPIARTVRWVGGSLVGPTTDPGLTAAFAGSSVVVHFAAPEDERPKRIGRTEPVFPTVHAGRYIAGLLAYSHTEEELLHAIDPLGKRAVQRYAGTLRELAQRGVGITWLTPDTLVVEATATDAQYGFKILDQRPEVITETRSLTGRLVGADSPRGQFALELTEGDVIRGDYLPSAEETLDGARGRIVTAEIQIERPAHASLPRAPRTRYTLLRVTHISPDRPARREG